MLTAKVEVNGELVGIFPFQEKHFRTGSKGFHTQGKLAIDGKRYQVNLMLIEIGRKNGKGKKN